MRILMVVSVFLPSPIYGGPTTVAMSQAKALAESGNKVTIIASNIYSFEPQNYIKESSRMFGDVEVLYFNSSYLRSKFSLIYSKKMLNWLDEHLSEYDVVHIHFARELIPFLTARKAIKAGVPVYLQTHGMLNRKDGIRGFLDKIAIRKTLESVNGVLVLQELEQQSNLEITPKVKTLILPNGIEVNPNMSQWDINSHLRKTVLFLARLHPRKKVLDFVEMAKILISRGINANFRIVGPDGGDLLEAQSKVREYNLSDKVTFIGAVEQEEAYDEFASASVYVLPSDKEPFPMSVLEALSVGTPTVATTGMHNKGLLQAYNSVRIVQPNPLDLAQAVEELLENPQLSITLSQNGKKLITEKLNIHKVAKQLEKVYSGN